MRSIEFRESLAYIFLRLGCVVIAFVVAASVMTLARIAEAEGYIPLDASQVGSTVYFHIASFGLLWWLLRRPPRWERAVVVGIWLILDYFIWIFLASFDGRDFLWDYLRINAVSTLQHRYCFIGITVLTVTLAKMLFKRRIYSRKEQLSSSLDANSVCDEQPTFSLTNLFVVITYAAIGAAIARLSMGLQFDTTVSAIQYYLYNFTLAAWSVSRGAFLWLLALFCLGSGRFTFLRASVVLSMLVSLDVLLIIVQDLFNASPMVWTFYTPNSVSKFEQIQHVVLLE